MAILQPRPRDSQPSRPFRTPALAADRNGLAYGACQMTGRDYRVVGLVEGADAETSVVMLQAAMSFCRLVWIGWRRRMMASSRAMSNCLAASPNSVIA